MGYCYDWSIWTIKDSMTKLFINTDKETKDEEIVSEEAVSEEAAPVEKESIKEPESSDKYEVMQ